MAGKEKLESYDEEKKYGKEKLDPLN